MVQKERVVHAESSFEGGHHLIAKQKKTMVKYMHIVEQIKENIAKGILVPQDLLPSENELMAEFGVSSITVRKAMETMVQQGIVYRVKGKGTYVADPQSGQENANGYKKVFLIFDVEAALDASLTKIVQGIQQYYQNKKSQLVLEKYAFCEEYLRDGKCKKEEAGFIIYISAMDDEKKLENLRRLSRAGVKFVCIDRYLRHYPVNYVGCNNHDGAYSAVEYLAELGHTRIGFVYERPEISSERERFDGYTNAMIDHCLKEYIEQPYTVAEMDNCVRALVAHRHSAMVCANDFTAAVLIKALKDAGMGVPSDVSVVGFDDAETYRFHQPALTTIRQDFFALGYESARVLNKIMSETVSGCTRIYTPAQLIVRESTGVYRQNG